MLPVEGHGNTLPRFASSGDGTAFLWCNIDARQAPLMTMLRLPVDGFPEGVVHLRSFDGCKRLTCIVIGTVASEGLSRTSMPPELLVRATRAVSLLSYRNGEVS